jgi:ClpP class serine protease
LFRTIKPIDEHKNINIEEKYDNRHISLVVRSTRMFVSESLKRNEIKDHAANSGKQKNIGNKTDETTRRSRSPYNESVHICFLQSVRRMCRTSESDIQKLKEANMTTIRRS